MCGAEPDAVRASGRDKGSTKHASGGATGIAPRRKALRGRGALAVGAGGVRCAMVMAV